MQVCAWSLQMYFSHVQHIVFILQSFFGGQNWHLLLLSAPAAPAAASGGSGQDAAPWTAFTTAADAAVWGRRSLLWMSGVKCAFPSCSRNTILLFRLSGNQVRLVLFHITKALYEDTSMMLLKMTRGQPSSCSCKFQWPCPGCLCLLCCGCSPGLWLASVLMITDLSCFVQYA